MSQPLVTIGVASYNHAGYIIETLESIRQQSYQNIQLVVVDDCSPDNSVEVIREWIKRTGYPCELVINERNRGICFTFNESLRRAKGKYYNLIGSDDRLLTDKIAMQVTEMEALREDVALSYSDAYIIDAAGIRQPQQFISIHRPGDPTRPQGRVFLELLSRNWVPIMTALFRKSALDAVGGLFDESLLFEDYDILLRLARNHQFHFLDTPTAEYRVHATNQHQHGATAAWEKTLITLLLKQAGYSQEADRIIERHALPMMQRMFVRAPALARELFPAYNRALPGDTKMRVAALTRLPYWLVDRAVSMVARFR